MNHAPSIELYTWLNTAFDFFNRELFEEKLPGCIITVQREKKTMGYFSADRWANAKGAKTHEIAINPAYFAGHKFIEILQTLVHEMCHMWQHIYGKPSRTGYHNKEWSDKMVSFGLIPTHNGRKDGKRTGQKMGDYPEQGGKFLRCCEQLIADGFKLEWVDRYPAVSTPSHVRDIGFSQAETDIETPEVIELLNTAAEDIIPDIESVTAVAAKTAQKRKAKYTCPDCSANVWGKTGLHIQCDDCNQLFQEA